MGCPPPLHAQALARAPLAAVRLHRASRTPTPAAVRWRRRSRQRGRTPAASRRLPGQQQRQAPPTAPRPPSFGIQAEAGVPLSVLQLSRPAGPAAPEVRHPYPKACHGVAHQALGALQGPASALRRLALRGAAPASHATETQGHGPGLHPARANLEEQADNAKRPASSSGSPSHGSEPSGPPPTTMPSTQRSERR